MSWLLNKDVQTEAQRWLSILTLWSVAFYIGCGRKGKGKRKSPESWGGIRAPFAENCSGIQVGAVIALNKLNAKRTNGDCNAAVHARWMILA